MVGRPAAESRPHGGVRPSRTRRTALRPGDISGGPACGAPPVGAKNQVSVNGADQEGIAPPVATSVCRPVGRRGREMEPRCDPAATRNGSGCGVDL
jgi:hypothetical protein